MNDYLSNIYQSLTEAENQLFNELEKISEAKKAIEKILSPKGQKSTSGTQDQSGKNTVMQAQLTKRKIVEFIASNKGASVAQIQKNVKKSDGKPYAANSIRTYLSELTKVNRVQRVKGKRIYEVML
jgi:Tfp pilus assembly major pilin PilA